MFTANLHNKPDCFLPFHKPNIFRLNQSKIDTIMWRNIAKRAIQVSRACSSSSTHSQDSIFPGRFYFRPFELISGSRHGFREIRCYSQNKGVFREDSLGICSFGFLRNQVGFGEFFPKGYASVAEAVSSTDIEEDTSSVDEVQDLVKEMRKEERRQSHFRWRNLRNQTRGMSQSKYLALRKRQVKIETEAWEQAVKEYKELLEDMCEQKLAPNLPYMKKLFLGWFEPFRDAIAKEQELCRAGKIRLAYASFFDRLPADMMAVITMHKLMSLLMTGAETGITKVVYAACSVGDAIEHEVCDFDSLTLLMFIQLGLHCSYYLG